MKGDDDCDVGDVDDSCSHQKLLFILNGGSIMLAPKRFQTFRKLFF